MKDVTWEVDVTAKVDETVRVLGKGVLRVGAGSRIDPFVLITVGPGGVWIGRNVHVGAGAVLLGGGGAIEVGDGCSLSPRSTIYTSTDDFSADGLLGPCNPPESRTVRNGSVVMRPGSAIGHGAVLFPGTVLQRGAALGAYVTAGPSSVPGPWTFRSRVSPVRDADRVGIKGESFLKGEEPCPG